MRLPGLTRQAGEVAKEIRALPFACAAQVGNVFLVPGAWNCDFLNEIEGVFGGATHDDQHDAASGAHDVLAGGRYQRIRARDYRSAPEAQRRFNTRHYRTAGDPTGLQLDVPPSRRRAARQGGEGHRFIHYRCQQISTRFPRIRASLLCAKDG